MVILPMMTGSFRSENNVCSPGIFMNVAMMQPAFMPWQGFFELIYYSDCFIFLDDYQFSVQSYHQRNRLFVNSGQADWYTLPIEKTSFKSQLDSAKINNSVPWRTKFLKRLQQNYARTSFYPHLGAEVEAWLLHQHNSVADMNLALIGMICDWLEIKREFRKSSGFNSYSHRSKHVLDLLRWCGASRYYCARGSFPYMDEDSVFPVNDIEVLFQNYVPKPYQQIGSPRVFVPYLSILDALFNIGPTETLKIISTGTDDWSSWDDMKRQASQGTELCEEE